MNSRHIAEAEVCEKTGIITIGVVTTPLGRLRVNKITGTTKNGRFRGSNVELNRFQAALKKPYSTLSSYPSLEVRTPCI